MKKLNKLFYIAAATILFAGLAKSPISETSAANYTYVNTNASSAKLVTGYNGTDKYLLIGLETSDYASVTENGGNDYRTHDRGGYSAPCTWGESLIDYNGTKLNIAHTANCASYLNYYANIGSIGFNLSALGITATKGDVLTVPKDVIFPSYAYLKNNSADSNLYKTTEDRVFTFDGTMFKRDIPVTKVETKVTGLNLITGYNGSDKFFIIMLSVNDYADITENKGNDYNLSSTVISYMDVSNFATNLKLDGNELRMTNVPTFMNYFGNYGGIGINFNNNKSKLNSLTKITIPSGTTFPSYAIVKNNGDIVYETKEDITYTYYNNEFHVCGCGSKTYLTDETKHWQICDVCGEVINEHNHEVETGYKAPTCLEPGYENAQFCSVCGYIIQEGTEVSPLGHHYDTYECDETGHWQCCTRDNCENETEKEEHTWGNDRKTCSVCGYVRDVVFVTVNYGYINGSETDTVNTGDTVTVVADAPEYGKKFDGWYVDGEKVSSDSTYTFVASESITLEARYVDDADYKPLDPIEKEPTKPSFGCGGSIAAMSSIMAILSLAGIILVAKRKHN